MPSTDQLEKAIFDCDSEKLLQLLTTFQTKATEQQLSDYISTFTSDLASQFWRIIKSGIQKNIDIALDASSRIGCGGEIEDDEEIEKEIEKEKQKATEYIKKQSHKNKSKGRISNDKKYEEIFREKLRLFHGVISAAHVFSRVSTFRPPEFGSTIYALHTLLNYIDEPPSDPSAPVTNSTLDYLGDNFTASFSSSISLSMIIATYKYSISFLCEQLYLKGENGSTLFLPLVIIYLLTESLKLNSKEILVRRLYAIKNGFQFLEFTSTGAASASDEASALKGMTNDDDEVEEEDIFHKELLLRCFIHPTFLKCSDGEKLLSFFLTLNNGFLIKSVIKIIKVQLNTGIKTLSTIYGELFYRAWRDSSTVILNASSPGGTLISGPGGNPSGKGKKSAMEVSTLESSNLTDEFIKSCQYTLYYISEGLQELLHESSHINNAKHFQGLRYFFQAFHDLKRSEFMEEFLLYLYEPILWRGLKCANAIVRTQTSVLFFDVFPLQRVRNSNLLTTIYSVNPDEIDIFQLVRKNDRKSIDNLISSSSNNLNSNLIEQNELLLQKQFDILMELLMDGDPRVRVSSIFGVGHILRQYWEVIPINTAKNILKFITEQLACDTCGSTTTSSAVASNPTAQYTGPMTGSGGRVRHAVIKALKEVLRQPLSHGIMKIILPSISKLIHDRVERVRLEFIELLIQVKSIRDMHFYEIVPIRHLLFRFAQDKDRETISYALTELLLNSFFPQTAGTTNEIPNEPEERVFRCIKFIEQNELAAEAFYSNLHHYINIGTLTKFMVMVFLNLKDSCSLEENSNSKKKRSNVQSEKNELDDCDEIATKDRKRKKKKTQPIEEEDEDDEEVSKSLPLTTQFGILRVLLVMIKSSKKKFIKQIPSLELFFRIFNAKNFISWIEVVLSTTTNNYSLDDEDMKGGLMILSTTFELIGEVANLAKICDVSSFLNELYAIRDLFNVNTVLGEVLSPYFTDDQLVVEKVDDKKFLCKFILMKSAISFLQAMNYNVELIAAIKNSMQNFYEQISSTHSFVPPISVPPSNLSYILPIQVSCHALSSFLGFICDPDNSFSEISTQTADNLELLFKYIKLSMKILAKDSKLYDKLDVSVKKSLIVFIRGWYTYATYEDTSKCLLNLNSQEEKEPDSTSSIVQLIEFFHQNILINFFSINSNDPNSSTYISFLQELFNNFLLTITDSLHLIDEAHMSSVIFSLHAILVDYYKKFLSNYYDLSRFYTSTDPAFLSFPSILDRLSSIIKKNSHFDPTLYLSLSYVVIIVSSFFADSIANTCNSNIKIDEKTNSPILLAPSLHSSLNPVHAQYQKIISKIVSSYNSQKSQKKKLIQNLNDFFSISININNLEGEEKESDEVQDEEKKEIVHDDYEESNANEEQNEEKELGSEKISNILELPKTSQLIQELIQVKK